MRLPLFLPLLAAALHTAIAQPAATPVSRETALDNLLSERESDKALDAAIADARKIGISEQAILEARFLYHVDRQEDKAIAALLPEFLKQRELFKLGDSEIFGTKEDWLAVVEYVQAIDSLVKGHKPAFKTHITEAFWLSPRQAAAFAPHIERMRLDDAMSAVKLDFTTRLIPLAGGDPVALETLMTGKKALLLHFWSPASPECEASMPDFIATAATLGQKGIAVVSLIEDGTPQILTNARKMTQPLGPKPPGAWLIDSKDQPLGRELRVRTLPLFILVSNEGRVLFNGDPSDDAFWEKLGRIDPQVIRPGMPGPNR
jgi:hypothetical protein